MAVKMACIVFEIDGSSTKMTEVGDVTENMKQLIVHSYLKEKRVL